MNMEEAAGSNKVMGIRQIVRLREILHKWQSLTIGAKANNNNNNKERPSIEHHGGIPPEVSRQLRLSDAIIDSDEEYGCRTPEPPHGVPKGYLAVYVGPELRRFIIPTSYLSDPLFKVLLEKVEEEFGFDHSGALTIPCETETFKYLLKCMENHQKENNIDINAETSQSHQRSESPERSASPERSESPARCESPERTESPETSLPPADE